MKGLFIFAIFIASVPKIMSCNSIQDFTIWDATYSPDGKYIAVGGTFGSLIILDAKSLEELKSYTVGDVIISRLKWHPKGNLLAVITQSNTFKTKILNIKLNEWIELEGLDDSFRALDWNHSGQYLALSHFEKEISVYNTAGKLVSKFFADPKVVTDMDWHPIHDTLVTVGSEIALFAMNGDEINRITPRTIEILLLCVEWHPSGEFFATGDYGELESGNQKLVQYWNMEGTLIQEAPNSDVEYRNIRWNRTGSKLASASDAMRIWDSEGKLLFSSIPSNDYLWGIDWHPDMKSIVTSSSRGIITIWNDRAELINSRKL